MEKELRTSKHSALIRRRVTVPGGTQLFQVGTQKAVQCYGVRYLHGQLQEFDECSWAVVVSSRACTRQRDVRGHGIRNAFSVDWGLNIDCNRRSGVRRAFEEEILDFVDAAGSKPSDVAADTSGCPANAVWGRNHCCQKVDVSQLVNLQLQMVYECRGQVVGG